MRGTTRGILALVLAVAAVAVPLTVDVATAPPASAAPPANTAARTGVPANIYAIGDSITTATGTGNLGAEVKENSWVTGTHGTVLSMRHRLGISTSNAVNLASNGRRMQDFDDQANQLPATAQYVVVELGGNDLCRPSVGEMTTEANYRAQFRAGLDAVAAHAPNALVFVASIPDIYNLWYLRGAPSSLNPYVGEDTGQEGQARLYWDNPLIDVIPCKSLLDNPTSTAAADENRRLAVRARNLAFNQILEEECGAVLRCRYDGDAFFNRSSNRQTPPNGPLAAHGSWWFRDGDISHNDGFWDFLCPAPGILNGGTVCGDHFHPSLSGQAKLALGGHEASYQFQADAVAPTATATPDRAPDGAGVYAAPVEISFGGTDASGLRGQEVRVVPDGQTPGPWQQHIGLAPPVTVSATGTTHVQVRSLDNNGNVSASVTRTVTVDPSQFGDVTGTITGPSGPLSGIEVSLHPAGAPGALGTVTTGPTGTYAFADLLASGDVKVLAHDPSGVHRDEWFDGAASHATATTIDVPGGGSTTADLALVPKQGTIGGTVTGPSGPLVGIAVDVHTAETEAGVASAVTGAGGTYALDLAPGDYKVSFTDPDGDHLTEWHGDRGDHTTADVVTVTDAATTTVDAELTLTPGALGGTVSGPDGPISGITVRLHADGSSAVLATATTAVDGTYSFPLVTPGPYDVEFSDASGVHLAEWHDDQTAQATATTVTVTKTQTSTVDATLALTPGSITGTVSGPQGPLEGIAVVAEPSPPAEAAGVPVLTAADGSYEIADLAPGHYTVRVDPVPCAWWGREEQADVPTAGGADVVGMVLDEEPPAPHGLSGVPAWIDDAVDWLVDPCNDPQYMTGLPDGSFGANLDISRGQALRALWHIEGSPATNHDHDFSDVPAWIEDAVDWADEHGYMTGYPNGTFRANATISRGQIARLLFRLEGEPPGVPPYGPHGLTDVGTWIEAAVRWMVAEGHATGINGSFQQDAPITRAQFANMAFRIHR